MEFNNRDISNTPNAKVGYKDVKSLMKKMTFDSTTKDGADLVNGVRKTSRKQSRQNARNKVKLDSHSKHGNVVGGMLSRKERKAIAKTNGEKFVPVYNA